MTYDELKALVGTTIPSPRGSGKAKVVAVARPGDFAMDGEYGVTVILPTKGQGWPPTMPELTQIRKYSPQLNFNDVDGRCWNIGVSNLPPEVSGKATDDGLVPVEPTAPMTLSVLNMLRKKGNVTAIEAQGVLRCRALPARILELKRLGHDIQTTTHEDHTGQRYARYTLSQ